MDELDAMTDEQFQLHVLKLLRRELGLAGFARYLMLQPRESPGDYTRDREKLLEGITLEQIFADIERLRKEGVLPPLPVAH